MTIPADMLNDMTKPNIGGAWLWLCEFAISGQDTQCLAANTEDVNYASQNYDKFNFEVGRQTFSGEGSIPRVFIRFSNANLRMERIINETQGAYGATVKIIRVNEKFLINPITALEYNYQLLASESNNRYVTVLLGIPNPLTQRFPLRSFTSKSCPWATPTLFKGPECGYAGVDTTCTGTIEDCRDNKSNAARWGGCLGLDPSVTRV